MSGLKIAIAGLGTVGAGVINLLNDNRAEITARAGREIEIVAVGAKSKDRKRDVDISAFEWVEPWSMPETDADIVIELMGGEGDPAHALVKKSLEKGKSVVTANKALLAHHGVELAAAAEKSSASLLFEAAVAGGIPVIKTLREGLAANRISKLYGILNGTCNYILTEMENTGRDFAEVLKEAQGKGYAEAEPSLDVDGGDTAHKLCLLSSLAFGIKPDLAAVSVSGIRDITLQDIRAADELGYRIKLLGQAEIAADGRVVQTVEACLVPKDRSLAHVSGVLNAVYTEGNHSGPSFIEGQGAGAGPTASAVVADIIDFARGRAVPTFGIGVDRLKSLPPMKAEEKTGEYYMRLNVLDQPGVIADVAAILRDHDISIESLIQHGRDPGQAVTVVLTTHHALRRNLNDAVARISTLESIAAQPLVLEKISL